MIGLRNITCLNEQGKRENIEDSVYPAYGKATVNDRLFLVCDGVGGENKGEEASRIVAENFPIYFNDHPLNPGTDVAAYMEQAQVYVIGQMQDYIGHFREAAKMSTTLTLVNIFDDKILAAWCGDSRIYHFRNGEVLWRSTDHSLVSALIQQGEISEKEAEHHPQKNIILRSISAVGSPSEIDTYWLTDIQADDYILLCTDGVLEQMNEERFNTILTNTDADKRNLFLKYCEGKTSDNFSLYLLKLDSDKNVVPPKIVKKAQSNLMAIVVTALVVSAIFLGWYFFINKSNKVSKQTVVSKNSNISPVPSDSLHKHGGSDVTIPQSNYADTNKTKK